MYLVLPATISKIDVIRDVPCQWRGRLTNGHTFHIWYQHGSLTMNISSKPTGDIDAAVNANCVYHEIVASPSDEEISLDAAFVLLQDVLRPEPPPSRK